LHAFFDQAQSEVFMAVSGEPESVILGLEEQEVVQFLSSG
jgi:hypothetical protein